MAKTSSKKKIPKKYPSRSKDVPVTQEMLFELSGEVKAQFREVDARFKAVYARFDAVDARFDAVDARFDAVDARFGEMDARFDEMDAKIDKRFHEVKLLIEEQNARNRIVLDGLTNLFARQERLENKFDKLSLG